MYEARIFHEAIQLDGREVSAFALAPAKALSESVWRRVALLRCLIIRVGGRIDVWEPLGTTVYDGMLCLCVAQLKDSVPLPSLSLQDLGNAIGTLADGYASGILEPSALDLSSVRHFEDGLVVLTRPGGSLVPALPPGPILSESRPRLAHSLACLREQHRVLAAFIGSRLGIAVTRSFVPRVAGPGSVLAPDLRSFLRKDGHARSAVHDASLKTALFDELGIWAKAAKALVGGNVIVQPTAKRMFRATMIDMLGGRIHAAIAWGSRRRAAIAAVAIVAALAGILGGPMVFRRFGPPLSASLSAQELAERYLTALVELDMPFIDSVLKPPARLPYDCDLYAMAAVMAVQRGMARPLQLVESASLPAHEPEAPVWEISDSSIRSFKVSGEDSAYAELQYILTVGTKKEDRVDRLILARRKGYWVVIEHTAIISAP